MTSRMDDSEYPSLSTPINVKITYKEKRSADRSRRSADEREKHALLSQETLSYQFKKEAVFWEVGIHLYRATMHLQDLTKVLESYRGREKTMRTLQYGLLFVSPLASKRLGEAFKTFSTQMGMTRVVLRLFDDLSMLQYSLSTGLGHKHEDPGIRILQFLNNIVDQLYYPVEHLAWARDIKLLRGSSVGLWNASLILWTMSLVLSIIRSLRQIALLKQQSKTASAEVKEKLDAQYEDELLMIIMQASDLLNALNWMPKRPWANPFPAWQVGLLGLISSLIGFKKLLSCR